MRLAALMARNNCRQSLVGVFLGVLFGIITLSAGCGGGTSDQQQTTSAYGRATLTVRWPERTRLIPFAAESIRVRLTNGGKLLAETLLTRPEDGGTATASFDRLPVGDLTAEGFAYPNPDGTGVAQAQAQSTATITNGRLAQIRLTLGSTISQVAVTPPTANISVNQTISLTASAKNAADETVFTLPATMEWRSLDTGIATVEPGGMVRGIAPGTATIEVKETESGKTGVTQIVVSTTQENQAYAYDNFAYTPGTGLDGQNGGIGWSGAWQAPGPVVIASGNLTFGNLAVSGNSFRITAFEPRGDHRNWPILHAQPGVVRYWSVLVRPEAVTGGGFPGPYFGFEIRDRFFGKASNSTTIGIHLVGNGQEVSTGILPQANTTYFFVVRVTFGVVNDLFDFYVNPTPGQPLPTVPNATQFRPHNDEDVFGFKFSTSVPCHFDELRFGPTWESVSPIGP